nr:hypothetical protein [Paraburkholderia bannensis]
MCIPELPDLAFKIDKFNAMREAMVRCLDVLVVNPVAVQVASVNAMQNGLLNTGTSGVYKKMTCQARASETLPEARWVLRMRPLRMMEIQT